MKTIFLLLTLSALLFIDSEKVQAQTTWVPVDTVSNVEFYYQQVMCSGAYLLFLKIINNNTDSATVTWSLWPGGNTNTLSLAASQEAEGDCLETSIEQLHELIPEGLTVNDITPVITVQ